jgi:hypothetical protein
MGNIRLKANRSLSAASPSFLLYATSKQLLIEVRVAKSLSINHS